MVGSLREEHGALRDRVDALKSTVAKGLGEASKLVHECRMGRVAKLHLT